MFIFDIDGVFTQRCSSQFHCGVQVQKLREDDLAQLIALRNQNKELAFISGGGEEGILSDLLALGFKNIYPRVRVKLEAYQELLSFYDYPEQAIFYMGDDFADREIMERVGLAACPADAIPEIRELSQIISTLDGGHGCVSEVIKTIGQRQQIEL